MERRNDSVEVLLDQWRRERPDLDADVMGPIARLQRCATLVQKRLEKTFSQFGITIQEFDVLAALRRSGAPYRLKPTEIFSLLMITSGTMTNRLNRLETTGLIHRLPDQQDARSTLAQLTPKGLEIIDRVMVAHVENERELLGLLDEPSILALDVSLSRLLVALESTTRGDD